MLVCQPEVQNGGAHQWMNKWLFSLFLICKGYQPNQPFLQGRRRWWREDHFVVPAVDNKHVVSTPEFARVRRIVQSIQGHALLNLVKHFDAERFISPLP